MPNPGSPPSRGLLFHLTCRAPLATEGNSPRFQGLGRGCTQRTISPPAPSSRTLPPASPLSPLPLPSQRSFHSIHAGSVCLLPHALPDLQNSLQTSFLSWLFQVPIIIQGPSKKPSSPGKLPQKFLCLPSPQVAGLHGSRYQGLINT